MNGWFLATHIRLIARNTLVLTHVCRGLHILQLTSTCAMKIIGRSENLELFRLSSTCMFKDESLQLVDCVEKIDSAAPVSVVRLE